MTDAHSEHMARRALAAEQRTWPVPPGHFWATRRTRVVLVRVIGPRFAELRLKADDPPVRVQVVSLRRRRLSPSRVVLVAGDGTRTALHVLLPGEASPAQIGGDRTKPLPGWMVLDSAGTSDAFDVAAMLVIGIARVGYNLAHIPSILARQARRRAAAATLVDALTR